MPPRKERIRPADPAQSDTETGIVAEDEQYPPPPTLTDAFYVLSAALETALLDDVPAWGHCQEIQAWMMNAGEDVAGQAQQRLAWAHAVQLLEQVLGHPLAVR